MLDHITLTVSSVFVAAVSAFFFTFVWRLNKDMAGIRVWFISLLLQPIGWLLLTQRNKIHDFFTIHIANYFILLSICLFFIGTRIFYKKTQLNKTIIASFSVFYCLSFYYFYTVEPSITYRVYIVFTTSTVFMLLTAMTTLTLPIKQQTLGSQVFSIMSLLIVFTTILRILIITFEQQLSAFVGFSLSDIGALMGFILPYCMALSAFMLLNERRVIEVNELRKNATKDAQLKNHYLATLSHELRTPLNGMVGTAQLLKQRTDSQQWEQQLNLIIESGQWLATMSEQVLNFTALDHGKYTNQAISLANGFNQQNNNQCVELKGYLDSIYQLIFPLAKQKNLSFTLSLTENIQTSLWLWLDSSKIKQVLVNLLNNAIKFTQHGAIELKVSAKESNENYQVTFSVIDTGIGIDKKEQQSLLTPFKQSLSAEPTPSTGVGLGLFLVTNILHTMNSKLSITSAINKGSCFSFELVLKHDISAKNSAYQSKSIKSLASISPLTILLIEDMKINQDVVMGMLQEQQHVVFIASTGQQAITLSEKHHFDVILLDMILPDFHGLVVYDYIKQRNNLNHDTPIIAVTATLTSDDIVNYKTKGLSSVVKKPIDKLTLMQTIESVVTSGTARKTSTVNPEKSSSNRLFNAKTFSFIQDNLSEEELVNIVSQLPSTLAEYMIKIKENNSNNTQQKIHFHKLAGFSAQLGLELLAEQASGFERAATSLKHEDYDTLSLLIKDSITSIQSQAFRQTKVSIDDH